MAQGEQEQRSRIGVCGGNAGEGIFCSRSVLHCENAGRAPVFYPGVTVGNTDSHPFLATDYRSDARLGRSFNQRGRWEATEVLDTFSFQYSGNCVDCAHVVNALL
jgi:hypothetical protein